MTKLLCSALHLSATVLRLEAIHRFIRSGKLPTPSFFPVNTAAPLYVKFLRTGNYLHDSSCSTLDPTSYKSDDLRFHPSSSSSAIQPSYIHTTQPSYIDILLLSFTSSYIPLSITNSSRSLPSALIVGLVIIVIIA